MIWNRTICSPLHFCVEYLELCLMCFIFKGPGLVPVGSHGELGYWTNDTPQKKSMYMSFSVFLSLKIVVSLKDDKICQMGWSHDSCFQCSSTCFRNFLETSGNILKYSRIRQITSLLWFILHMKKKVTMTHLRTRPLLLWRYTTCHLLSSERS